MGKKDIINDPKKILVMAQFNWFTSLGTRE